MKAICGVDCCSECGRKDECKGCIETDGHPFGGRCIAAEYVRQGGIDAFLQQKDRLIEEFNSLGIRHLKLVFLCVNTDVTERIHRLLCIRSGCLANQIFP